MGEAVQELTALEMQVRGEQRQNCSLQGDFTARFWAAEERGAGGVLSSILGSKTAKGDGALTLAVPLLQLHTEAPRE